MVQRIVLQKPALNCVMGTLSICAVLAACSPHAGTAPAHGTPPASSAADAGERIYNGNCTPCHQQSGVGIPGVYPSLAGSPVVAGDPGELTRWVMNGQRPPSMPAGRYSTQMLQFGWLKPADAAALFTYLRSNFGNSATAVDANTVAKALAR